MNRPEATNSITDVTGLEVGHYTSLEAACGVTVILCGEGATTGVDVRGAAPGTRETDLLRPENLVREAHAIVLTGGSVYGLSSADGVVRRLSERGVGFPLEEGHTAPIVPAAALFDLGRGADYIPPITAEWGRLACENAHDSPTALGCVGAGTGAVAGGIKGGIGSASERLESGLTIAALIAVNSLGSVINPATGLAWELGLELEGEFGAAARRPVAIPEPPAKTSSNTTIGVIAVDAILTKAQAQKTAQMAHDGLARAIRPAHTMFDGDTIFCVSTGIHELPHEEGVFADPDAQALTEVGRAAADCATRAIVRAIVEARGLGDFPALCDLEDR